MFVVLYHVLILYSLTFNKNIYREIIQHCAVHAVFFVAVFHEYFTIVTIIFTFGDLWIGVYYGSTPPVFIIYLELICVM